MANEKIKRKYLVHYIDASFGGEKPNYVRIGKDLEEFNEELNPSIETTQNIWGESVAEHNGYEPSGEVDTYYARTGDPLYKRLEQIAIDRLEGDDCKTTVVTAKITEDGTCEWARREDVIVGVNSIGGAKDGYQIPWGYYANGNRIKGNFDIATKTFTEEDTAA